MVVLRQWLGRLAGTVVMLHLCLMAAVPTTLYLDLLSANADCTCPQGDGGACPMHHKMTASAETQPCVFRSAADSRSDAILSLLGPAAVLTHTVAIHCGMPTAPVMVGDFRPFDRLSVPDSPPPRG